MPSKTEKQRRYVYYLRDKYKDKSFTPQKYKWIWNDEWLQIKEELMKPYKRQFIEKTQFNITNKLLLKYYESMILEESFFGSVKSVKDFLSKFKNKAKKFFTKLYHPISFKPLNQETVKFEILYPDNRVGLLEVYFDFDSGNAAIIKSKGNEKYFKDKNLVEVTIKEVLNLLTALSAYCYKKVFNSEYGGFSKSQYLITEEEE
jgi:hypothetical protein